MAGDIVFIEGNRTVTTTAITACANVSIAGGSILTVGGFNITITGTTTLSGTIIHTSTTGTKTMGNVVVSGGVWTSNAAESFAITGLALSGSTFNGSSSGTFNVGSNLSVSTGTSNTFNAATITVSGTTTVDGTIIFASTAGTKTFIGLLTINSGGIWNNIANESITIRGGITNNGSFNAGTGLYTFNTFNQALSGTLSIPSATVTVITLTNNGTLTIGTALSGTGRLTQGVDDVLNIGGTSAITTLTATASGNMVNYTGAAQTVKSTTYYNLTITGSGTKTLGGAITISHDLNVNAGTLASATFQITGNATGLMTMAAGTALTLGTTTGATSFPTNFTGVNISLSTTSTVNYSSNLAQTISAVPAYGNLTLTSTAAITKTAGGAITVNGNLDIGVNNTLAGGTNTITVKGNVVNNGAHTSSGAGKISLSGGSAVHAISGSTSGFGSLELNDALGATFTGTGTTTVTGSLTVTSGTFTVNGFTTALTVTGITSLSGTLSFNSVTGTKTFTGLVTIQPGGIWNNNTINAPLTFRGGITNNGIFNAGTGLHTFTTNAQALSGTLSIPNVTVTGVTLTNNGTLTCTGALTGTGGLTNAATGILHIDYTGAVGITTLTATAAGNLVEYGFAGIQTVRVVTYHHLTLSNSGTKTFAATTVNGNLTLSGTVTATTGAALVIGGNLNIGNGTSFTAGAFALTVTGTTTVGAGTSGSLVISSATGTKLFTGLVTINTGGAWTNTAANCPVGFRGGITNNGTYNAGTGVHTFSTNSQGLTGIFSIPSVTVTAITLTNNGTLTCNAALTGTGGLTNASSGILHIDFTGVVGVTTLTATAVGNAVYYGFAGNQTVKSATYHNLILSASGTKTFAGVTTINGNLSISGTAVANLGTYISSSNILTLIGIGQPNGSWGGTGSGASHINPVFFAAATGILNVSTSACISWIGLTSTDWHTASNWCGGVPTSSIDVFIPSGGNQPVIGAAAVCNNINVNSGSTLTITGSNALTVHGDWTNDGTFIPNSGTVIFDGSGPANIETGNFNNISFTGSGTKTATGSLSIAGNVTISNNFTAGPYTHAVGGNWTNTGTFTATGSTINFNGASASNIGASNFDNITISGAGTKTGTGTITAAGNFNLTSGSLVFSNPTSNSMTISGDYLQTGGVFDFNTNTSGTSALYLGGNLTQTSGAETMTTSGSGALNGVITFNGTGTQTMSFANPSGSIWVIYSIPASQSVQLLSNVALNSANGVTQAGFQGEINVSGTFDLGTYTVTQAGGVAGTAVFTLNSGATLITANAGGISGSISSTNMTNTFSSAANYEFLGASTGTFTTSPSVNTVNNLIINSPTDVALTNSLEVGGQLQLIAGNLTLGANTLTIAGSSPTRTNGTIDASNAGATLAFTNPAAIILPASIYTGNVNNLTVNGAGGITATSDFTVSGILNLESANPSAIKGSLDMWDGSAMRTLTMGASSVTTGSGDVSGIVKRTSFVANTSYSFGNQFTTLTLASGGTLPAEIGVKIIPGVAPSWKPDAIQRTYDIVQTGGSATGVTLNLHYLDNELNGNPEADLFSWDYQDVINPIVLEKHTRTGQSMTDKWVSTFIEDIVHFGTSYNDHSWTLAKSVYVTFQGSKGWRMIASPTLTTFSDLLSNFISQGVPGSSYPDIQPNFLWFNETDTFTTNMSWRTSKYDSIIVPGRGYYLYVFDSISQATPTSPIYSDELPRQMTSLGNAYFPGNFSYSGTNHHHVTYTPRAGGQVSQSATDTVFYDTNIADEGWNLMGNPTISTLDWDAPAGWTKTNLDNTIYIWDPAVNQYRVWNGIDGTLPLSDGLISPFQAFWVRANNPNPILDFTSDVLTTGGTFYGGNAIKSASATIAPSAIGLSLNSSGLESNVLVSFKDDGKVGPDPWDGYRLEPLSNSWMELFTLSSVAHTMPLVINNLPADGPDCVNLPLFVGGQRDGLPVEGTYTLNWELPPDWPSDWAIALNDHGAKKAISMRREHSYSFSVGNTKSAIADTIRNTNVPVLPPSMIDPVATGSKLKSSTQIPPFSIVIQKGETRDDPVYLAPEPALLQNYPNPFIQQTTFRFSLPSPATVTLKVFDIYGHLIDVVADRSFETGIHNLPWSTNNTNPGIYLLQMDAGEIVKTKKLVIINQ